jgi:DNA-binding winged helix-turn-helix (wHTH) protein/tetratricopeptide (TPR) repeat protein
MATSVEGSRAGTILRFGPYEMDPASAELRRRGLRIQVQEMPLRVLEMLLERPGEVVSREQFFTRLWPDDAYGILDDNLNTAIRKLRLALSDSARRPRYIETIPRRGYRFNAPVESLAQAPEAPTGAREAGNTLAKRGMRELSQLFVGRQRELDELRGALDACLAGRDRLLIVAGEAGIGKTRIAERLAEDAAARGVAVLWGRSLEERGGPPYWPWIQVLRALIRASDDDLLRQEMDAGAGDIAGIVPELAARLGVQPPEALDHAELNRFRLFESIAAYLQRVARRTPLLFVFDNLHWAGRPSLLLLEFLTQSLAESPILFLGTYRGSEVSRQHPLFDTLGALNRDSHFKRIHLRGLERTEVTEFFAGAAGTAPPAGLIDAIYQQTEGNPFFVAEVVRLLLAEGVVTPGKTGIQAPAGRPLVIRIPEGIREVIGKRLNHLSKRCNNVLGQAAVIGREFPLRVLRALITEMDEDTLLQALEEAENAGVIEEDAVAANRYRFNHALIRETLYDELSASGRARCHARIGEIIERLHRGDPEPYLPQLAHHFSEAARSGRSAKALEYNMRAATKAESVLAYEEAASYYQTALEMLELEDVDAGPMRCDIVLAVARSMGKGGRIPEALDWIRRTAELARRLGYREGLIEACRVIDYVVSNLGVAGAQAMPLIEETLRSVGGDDSATRATLLGALARAAYNDGQPRRAEAATADSIAMARRVGDSKALVSALRARLYARYPPENVEVRYAAAREMLALAEALGDPELQRDAHDLCFYDLLEMGDMAKADLHLARSGELGQAIRQPFYVHNHLVYRAMRVILEGHYDEGEKRALQALERGERVRRESAEGIFGMQMFAIRRDQGRLGELAGAVRSFAQERPAHGIWQPGLALIYADLEMADEARAVLEQLARDDFAAVPRDVLWPTCLAFLAEVAAEVGERHHAAAIYELLKPYRHRALVVGACVAFLGAAAHYLGLLAHVLGRRADAATHFEEAMRRNESMGARPWLARTQHAYGSLLLDGSARDQVRGRQLLGQALVAARDLRMRALQARIEHRLSVRV